MSKEITYIKLNRIAKTSELTYQSFEEFSLDSINCLTEAYLKKLKTVKQAFNSELIKELNNYERDFHNFIISNNLETSSFSHFEKPVTVEEICEGEESMIAQLKHLLAMDLSAFGEVRDILHNYIFRVQMLMAELKEIS